MSHTNALVDLGDGTTVSNNSPQSPTTGALLDNPITLDFDPMSFQFKEDSPLTSPSDNSRELGDTLSPSQNVDVVDFFDPFCPVKEESPTDYYPNVMIDQTALCDPLSDHSPEFPPQEVSYPNYEVFRDPAISVHSTTVCQEETTVTFTDQAEMHDTTDLLSDSPCTTDNLIAVDSEEIEPTTDVQMLQSEETGEYDTAAVDDNQHVIDQDDVFQHDECVVSETEDFSRRGKISSVSSSVSSKSERSEKKSRKTSSTSSESSFRDEEREVKCSKISRKDEKIIQKNETIDRKSEKSSPKNENYYRSHNGIETSAKLKNGIDGNHIENSTLDVKDSSECPISVTDLRSTYVCQTAQEFPAVSPSKEIIDTGVDLKSLKSSYTQHAGEERDISPNRETISTGIDIKALKSNFTVAKAGNKSKGTEVIETGVSVRTLKSSFTKSDEESHLSNFQEEVKPSVDRAKVQRTFSQSVQDDQCLCKICGKHVYQMEKMKAEKNVFHKNCFRCKECNKLLNVDTYQSNEGDLYCKAHFKQLFQPKARFDGEDLAPRKQRRNELIIRENIPAELPPDVVRADSKPDHGLESLPVNLSNLKSKFEQYKEDHHLPSTTDVCTLQRSASVMARLAKYQSAVSGEGNENGDVSDTESEGECEDPSIIKPTKHKEKVVFSGMSSLKSQWETGSVTTTKEERIEEKKEELNKLRQRICLGRSESMKAVYEKACQESTKGTPSRPEPVDLGRDIKATRLKEKFEKGELVSEVDEEKLEKARREKEEELSVFTEPVMATDAKKMFKQIDATVKTTVLSPSKSPSTEQKESHGLSSQTSVNDTEVIKCSEPTAKEEIPVDTTDLSQRFKFFENYAESPKERKRFQITPPREPAKEDSPEPDVAHDPNIIRAVDNYADIPATDTARRMLDKFKALEKETPSVPAGPKPMKRITPPREYTKEDDHDSSPEPERDPSIIRATYKTEDDIVVEADKAKSLKAKFENWDVELRENKRNEDEEEEDFLPQVDTTKTLRAKFEAIKEDTLKPVEKPKPKVNRFVQEYSGAVMELCSICGKKVYPMEKMETSGMRLHKNCFRCAHCSCMLRLENYTTSGGRLYCTPHFKQLFISRGNYDEGFGREQHKEKWNRSCNNTPTPRDLQDNCDVGDYTNGDVPCLEQTV